MKRVLHISALFALLLFVLTGCNSWKDFEIGSVSVQSITPRGLKAADMTIAAAVRNPGKAIQIDSISGVIRVADNPVIMLAAEEILIESGDTECVFPVKGTLQNGINIPAVLGTLTTGDTGALKMDIRAYARIVGTNFGKTIEYTDIPLVSLLNR